MPAPRSSPWIEPCTLSADWTAIEGPTVLEVAQGEILVRGGDDLVRAATGDLVCVTPETRCSARAAGGSARVERLVAARSWVESARELAGSRGGPGEARFLVDRRGTDRARQGSRLLREVAGADRPTGEDRRLRLAARCVELLAMTLESRGTPLSPGIAARGSARRARFLRAVEELGGESLDEVTLPGLARRAGLSERHVSRLFQLELGKTFREHVSDLRLARAKTLLRGTGMSVIEVAGETGWSSLAHFNSVFRRRVGSTPTQFRVGESR